MGQGVTGDDDKWSKARTEDSMMVLQTLIFVFSDPYRPILFYKISECSASIPFPMSYSVAAKHEVPFTADNCNSLALHLTRMRTDTDRGESESSMWALCIG
ncbi:unnamed protein product [Brugia pahangi]|uniref:Uncharacterized protein n=1 Tax=Brugia pahangi TaxID=6280 RepID=A0A0N4TZ49_BRUPA|nr:unnamed protein product [Brugia pahangi]